MGRVPPNCQELVPQLEGVVAWSASRRRCHLGQLEARSGDEATPWSQGFLRGVAGPAHGRCTRLLAGWAHAGQWPDAGPLEGSCCSKDFFPATFTTCGALVGVAFGTRPSAPGPACCVLAARCSCIRCVLSCPRPLSHAVHHLGLTFGAWCIVARYIVRWPVRRLQSE